MTPLIASNFPTSDLVQGKRLFAHAREIPHDESFVAITGDTEGTSQLSVMPAIRTLWVANLKPNQLPHVASMQQLTSLCIRGTRLEDLGPLGSLTGLKTFILDNAPRLTRLNFLQGVKQLKALHFTDIKRLTDIAPLAHLSNLEELHLFAGIWNPLRLCSLEPLAKLRHLKILRLGPTMRDPTLRPLGALKQLEELALNINGFPLEEYAWLAGQLPRVRCAEFDNILTPFPHKACRKCGADSLAIPLGKGQKMLCQRCDASKIASHRATFERVRAESAAQRQ